MQQTGRQMSVQIKLREIKDIFQLDLSQPYTNMMEKSLLSKMCVIYVKL